MTADQDGQNPGQDMSVSARGSAGPERSPGPGCVTAGGGDAVAVFSAAVRRLFTDAGSPKVAQVAKAAGVSAATVSNWRTGRHLPADFDTIEPMIVWLTDRARHSTGLPLGAETRAADSPEAEAGRETDAGTTTGAAPVLSVRQWQALFDAASGSDQLLPALVHTAQAAQQWISLADRRDVAAARCVLLACLEVSPTGRIGPRLFDPRTLACAPSSITQVVDALVDLGVLVEQATTITDPAPGTAKSSVAPAALVGHQTDQVPAERVPGEISGVGGSTDQDRHVSYRLVDIRVVDLWPQLQTWVEEAWEALVVRSGLEHDAQRWLVAGRPKAWLYDHVRLELTATALIALAYPSLDAPTRQDQTSTGGGFRFGAATLADVPASTARFWATSQAGAAAVLRVHQMIMAVIVTLIAALVILAAVAGAAWT